METFSVVELRGSFFDIGHQHGTHFKDQISYSLECLDRTADIRHSKEAGEIVQKCQNYAKKYASELVEEIRGIAAGSKIDFDRVFALNCYSELWYAHDLRKRQNMNDEGCTTLAVAQKCTKGKDVYLAWNCDFYNYWEDSVILLKIFPSNRHPFLMFTYAGVVGANAGMNPNFGLVVNGIPSKGRKWGVPYSFICRKVLQQSTIGYGLEAILSADRSTGSSKHFLLTDKEGEICSVETSDKDFDVMYADKGFIGHTNNYVSLKMKLNGVEVKGASQTFIRLGRINRLLRDSAGMVDLIRIKEFLSDHVNYPYAICRHTQKEEERSHMPDFADFLGDNSKTIASFIFAIQEQKAYVAKGNPCVGSYTEYKL